MDFGWQCHSVTYPGGRVEVMNGGFHSQAGNPVTVTDLDGNVREYRGITDGELAKFRAWVGDEFEECEPIAVDETPHNPRELRVRYAESSGAKYIPEDYGRAFDIILAAIEQASDECLDDFNVLSAALVCVMAAAFGNAPSQVAAESLIEWAKRAALELETTEEKSNG